MEYAKKHVLIWGAIFLALVGLVLAIHQLYVMCIVLALLPTGSYLMSRNTLGALAVSREAPGVVKEGERRRVRLLVSNEGLRRRYFLTVADQVPDGLQVVGDAATLIASLASEEQVEVEYEVEAMRRGVFTLGPALLRHSDLIGLFRFAREAGGTEEIVVHPTPERVPEDWTRATAIRAMQRPRRRFRGEGTELYGTRQYVPGDDLRRVDWKSTARRGALIVREYERAEATDCVILLDLQARPHAGQGNDSTLERGVKVAASLSAYMLARGSGVGLVAAGADDWSRPPSADPRQRIELLDALARVQADGERPLAAQFASHRQMLPAGGLIAVVSPTREVAAVELATRILREGYAVAWMVLAAPWRNQDRDELTEEQLAARLASRGVRAYVIEPGRELIVSMRRAYRVA
ncbi:MAG TPA: DUF58 domain-containing protein [Armatimonadota bacterium]|nr:DUF58 domain-containing protein [Armatimonadota bacterium]